MDSLSIAQLEKVPWFSKDNKTAQIPPQPSIHEIKKLVNMPFAKRNKRYANFYAWSEIIKCIKDGPCRILDAACGRGVVSQILFFKGHNVFACDIQDYFMADRRNIDFRLVDLNERIPYEDNHFDKVINCESLQYLYRPLHFIKETVRVLKNRGNLILSVPNIHNLQGRYTFFRTGKLVFYDIEPEILKSPTMIYLPYLLQLLKSNGFKIIEIKGTVPLLSLKLRVLNAIFGNLISDRKDNIIRFSHSLVINAEIAKSG